jgi:hypothetical protein
VTNTLTTFNAAYIHQAYYLSAMSRRHRTSSSAREHHRVVSGDLLHLVHGPREFSTIQRWYSTVARSSVHTTYTMWLEACPPRPLFSPANSPPRELLVSETNNKTKSRGPSGQTLIPCACEYVNLCYIGMHASRARRSTRWTSRWMNYHVH